MPVKSVPVRQIIATTPEWIHALGSDESLYLVPADPQTYSYQHAYCDSVALNVLGIPTLDAEVLCLPHDLALKAGLATGGKSDAMQQQVIGWRLPKEEAGCRLLQILPLSWLPRVINREQFLEVLLLDLWFKRFGQRQALFRQTGERVEAIFMPAGDPVGTQKCTVEQVRYYQTAVYSGLAGAGVEAGLKAKVASLTLSDLGLQLNALPDIGLGHKVLKPLWFETMANKACLDQSFMDAMEPLFDAVVHKNHDNAFEMPVSRLQAASNRSLTDSPNRRCG